MRTVYELGIKRRFCRVEQEGVMFEYGTVNTQNIKEVADQLRKLLTGRKYTTVHCFEYKNFEPEARLHQELGGARGGDNVNLHFHSDSHAQVIICDSYGVGGFSTSRTEPGYDPDFNAPYVVFKHNQFNITHRAPSGKLIRASYTVE